MLNSSADPDGAAVPRPARSRHGRITAVSMMKEEGPYLLEWVAHQIAIGFTDIVVYTNDCTDGTDRMLIRLEELGLAHHRVNRIAPGRKPQPSAIRQAQTDPVVCASDWVMVFDADEFPAIRHGDGTLDALIAAVEERGGNGIVITWRVFGSAGIRRWSPAPVTEQFLMAAPPVWNKGWGVKTLFRFDPGIWKLGIHRPTMRNKVLDTDVPRSVHWLNGSGDPMEDYFKFRGWRSILRTVGYDWVQMNHYAVKSAEAYLLRTMRGNVNDKAGKYDDGYWALQDRNEMRDDTMLRYSRRRGAILSGLLADPVLNRLHRDAVAGTRARLTAIRSGPDHAAFLERIEAAARLPIDEVAATPPKPRDPAKIAARMADARARNATAEADAPPGRAAAGQAPVPLYLGGAVDVSAPERVERPVNHSLALPADPRIFTPAALAQIAEGKFERNLARNLPRLVPPGGDYLEFGGASGFLAGHLARVRPDLGVRLRPASAAHADFARRLWRDNDLPRDRAPRLLPETAALSDLWRDRPPDLLALADPAIAPAVLAALLADADLPAPRIVMLTGRLWSDRHGQAQAYEDAARRAGYVGRLALDPMLALAFAREGLR